MSRLERLGICGAFSLEHLGLHGDVLCAKLGLLLMVTSSNKAILIGAHLNSPNGRIRTELSAFNGRKVASARPFDCLGGRRPIEKFRKSQDGKCGERAPSAGLPCRTNWGHRPGASHASDPWINSSNLDLIPMALPAIAKLNYRRELPCPGAAMEIFVPLRTRRWSPG